MFEAKLSELQSKLDEQSPLNPTEDIDNNPDRMYIASTLRQEPDWDLDGKSLILECPPNSLEDLNQKNDRSHPRGYSSGESKSLLGLTFYCLLMIFLRP